MIVLATSTLVGRKECSQFLSTLIGREQDLDNLLRLLQEQHRLITIIGPAGVGKTTLAEHLAYTLANEFDRDVVLVPLSSITDPARLVTKIADALEVDDDSDTPIDACINELRQRTPLLVLDNLEQIPGAGPPLTDLLTLVPGLVVIATSRSPLHVRGEQLYQLAPLPSPRPADDTDLARVEASSAVALFMARARAVRPSLRLDATTAPVVAHICRRLDGLPLAIELAAARCAILSPQALASRLDKLLRILGHEHEELPERQRTLRNAITWSYDLLRPEEQRLFRMLSLFPGDVTLEAIEGIVQLEPDLGDAYVATAALVDQALLQSRSDARGQSLFLMLNTLRDYGQEQLEERDELAEAHRTFLQWAVTLAEDAEQSLLSGSRSEWVQRLELEWPNLRQALGSALDTGAHDQAARILIACWRFVSITGKSSEARRYLDRLLLQLEPPPTLLSIKARIAAANLAENQGDLGYAEYRYREALDEARAIDDVLQIGSAEMGLGKIAMDRSDLAMALAHYERAEAAAHQLGNRRLLATIHGNTANLYYHQGNLEASRTAYERCIVEFETLGDERYALMVRSNLGAVQIELGDFHAARITLTEVVNATRESDNTVNLPFALANLGKVWFVLGDTEQANRLMDEALTLIAADDHAGKWAVLAKIHVGMLVEQGRYKQAAALAADCILAVEQTGACDTLTRVAIHVAHICNHTDRHDDAIRLLYGALANTGQSPLLPNEQQDVDAFIVALRPLVTAARWRSCQDDGTAMTYDDLARDALVVARSLANVQPPPIPLAIVPPSPENPLTKREQEVLNLLAEGASSRTLADSLFISPRTASTHVENILRKLETNSRAAAVALALRNGWV